jgi:hypothetical protein
LALSYLTSTKLLSELDEAGEHGDRDSPRQHPKVQRIFRIFGVNFELYSHDAVIEATLVPVRKRESASEVVVR